MLVYTKIAGESAPEGVTLDGDDPTVGDLLQRLRNARAAKSRDLSLPFQHDDDAQPLSSVGVRDGDLVVVHALGDPIAERVDTDDATPAPDEEVQEDEPRSSRKRRPRQAPEYEQLTKDLQWHAPYHIDGEAKRSWEVWDQRNTVLRCQDWEAYRAPDKLYYRTYTARQAKADNAVSTAFEFAEADQSIGRVDQAHVERLRGFLGTLAFADWGLCILHQHATRFALSSWIAGAAQFIMFDQLRHAQLYGRLTLAYDQAHTGFEDGRGHDQWLNDERFQPVRRLVEEQLALLDWAQGMLIAGVLFEPVYTATVHGLLNEQSTRSGDELTIFVTHSIAQDKERHRGDAEALLDLLLGDPQHAGHNRELIQSWADEWLPKIAAALRTFVGDTQAVVPALERAVEKVNERLEAAGLQRVTVDIADESLLEAV